MLVYAMNVQDHRRAGSLCQQIGNISFTVGKTAIKALDMA